MNFKRLFLKNKNNKLLYYIRTIIKGFLPSVYYRWKKKSLLNLLNSNNQDYILSRVNYYNQLDSIKHLSDKAITIGNYKIPSKIRVYYFDSIEYLRYFEKGNKFEIIPGDVTHIPNYPAIVKSRPILGDVSTSVLLNLDKARHFNFIKDSKRFESKRNILVGRSGFNQLHRARFFDLYKDHPLCDLRKSVRKSDIDYLSISEHLDFKFILALEGNDVATNLKWIMSSNSIAVMPKPTYETWFMEGKLIADYHYICIKDDYSDLQEKLEYYIANPNKALEIIGNAHEYIDQFKNKDQEDLISILVLQKYFKYTN